MTTRGCRFGILAVGIAFMLSQGPALAAEPEAIASPCEMAGAPPCGAPLWDTIFSYRACSALASSRMLSLHEAHDCSWHYTRLKVNLVGLTMGEYLSLPARQRAALSLQGYAALRSWREGNRALWPGVRLLSGVLGGPPVPTATSRQ